MTINKTSHTLKGVALSFETIEALKKVIAKRKRGKIATHFTVSDLIREGIDLLLSLERDVYKDEK